MLGISWVLPLLCPDPVCHQVFRPQACRTRALHTGHCNTIGAHRRLSENIMLHTPFVATRLLWRAPGRQWAEVRRCRGPPREEYFRSEFVAVEPLHRISPPTSQWESVDLGLNESHPPMSTGPLTHGVWRSKPQSREPKHVNENDPECPPARVSLSQRVRT